MTRHIRYAVLADRNLPRPLSANYGGDIAPEWFSSLGFPTPTTRVERVVKYNNTMVWHHFTKREAFQFSRRIQRNENSGCWNVRIVSTTGPTAGQIVAV